MGLRDPSHVVLDDVQKSGLLCLMDIAAGMEHLHSMGVLHVSPASPCP